MRIFLTALAFFAVAGTALADGPVRLTDAQMDGVTAAGKGTVKWFNATKGFGLLPDGRG